MTLADLTDEELVTFVALCKLIIRADREFTPDEQKHLVELAAEPGPGRWPAAIESAKAELNGRMEVIQRATTVGRRQAQEIMIAKLEGVAGADGVIEQEEEILDWLREAWKLE